MNLLSLDLGTQTGWALGTGPGSKNIIAGTASFKPGRFEGGGMRFLRFRRWLTEMAQTQGGIQEIVFEEVRGHKGTDAAHIYGGMMAILTLWCDENDVPYEGIPVGTIKKFITGKGNANKELVIQGVQKQGFFPKDDNEADAIALLLYRIKYCEMAK